MAHWKNLSNYDYLGAYSIKGISEEVTLTIKDIKRELVTANGGNKENCIVAHFVEESVGKIVVKPMVLNKTNCKTIEKIYGTGEIEDWLNKKITVYPTTTKFARETVECLRIKPEIPQPFVCSVCGKEIEQSTFIASKNKYGRAFCSKECLDKVTEKGE